MYDATGIALGPSKEALVAARVGKRMRALGLTSYRAYLKRVAKDDTGAERCALLIDSICTNVTSFFREEDHFGFVREVVLERLADGAGPVPRVVGGVLYGRGGLLDGDRAAATSRTHPERRPQILGTDLSTQGAARRHGGASTPPRRSRPYIRGCASTVLHARPARDETPSTRIRPECGRPVIFRQLNLADPPSRSRVRSTRVLCAT